MRGVKKGEEVFNTFGVHGNAHLIHKYGFAEMDNEHVFVQIAPQLVAGVIGQDRYTSAVKEFLRQRREQQEESGEKQVEEEIENVATISANGDANIGQIASGACAANQCGPWGSGQSARHSRFASRPCPGQNTRERKHGF